MRINLYDSDVTVAYSYNSTYDIYTPTSWALDPVCSLPDTVSCFVREEKNGVYELALSYVANGTNAAQLQTDRILGVYCPLRNSVGENYFRIYRVERDLGGHISVSARHVSGDLAYHAVTKGGLSEIQAISGGIQNFGESNVLHSFASWLRHATNTKLPFTFSGDAATANGFQMAFCTGTSARAYLGGEQLQGYDKTALQAFPGSAYLWDKWDVSLWSARGTARNVQINYGTNMRNLVADDNTDGIYTYVCGYYLQTDGTTFTKYVSSLYSTNYTALFPFSRTKMVDFSAEVTNTYPDGATSAQITALLNTLAQAERDRMNAAGVPIRDVTIDAVAQAISDVYLCDTVNVLYRRNGLELNASMEIVAYEWDVLMQRYSTITLGTIQMDLAKEIAKQKPVSVSGIQSNVATLQNSLQDAKAAIEQIIEATDAGSGSRYTKVIKFSDGTMICVIQQTYTGAISTGWGSMYYSASISLGNWPVAFTGTPYVTIGLRANTDCLPGAIKNVSATSAGSTYVYRPASTTSATCQVIVTAIGKWQ